jgi:hypothetical protein
LLYVILSTRDCCKFYIFNVTRLSWICVIRTSFSTNTDVYVLPTYYTILYFLYSLLHVSALNLSHPKEATNLLDIYSVYGSLCICQ